MEFEMVNVSGDRLIITMEKNGKPRFEAIPGQPSKEERRRQVDAKGHRQADAKYHRTGVDLLQAELGRLNDLLKGVEKERN